MTIYNLQSNLVEYSHFHEIRSEKHEYFSRIHDNWIPLDTTFTYEVELIPSDTGKRNFQFDISVFSDNYIILSEKAINVLRPLLEPCGEFFNIITPSKRKKFIGYYPYKNVYPNSIIHLAKSDFRYCKNGKPLVYYPTFYSGKHEKDPLFVVEDMERSIYINDEFKQLVEQHDLKGFDFSEIIPVED